MTTWRMAGSDGRWIEYGTHGELTGDPQTVAEVRAAAGRPVPLAPMSALYTPTNPTDPVGVYLAAQHLMPGPVAVTGNPPAVPPPPPVPDDAVC